MCSLGRLSIVAAFLLSGLAWPGGGLRAQSLKELLADYKKYELPLPPEDSELVAIPSGRASIARDGTETAHVHLAFVLKRATDQAPAVLLVGTEEFEVPTHLAVQPLDIADVDSRHCHAEWHTTGFSINSGLATALQFKALGWDDKAEELWNHCSIRGAGHPHSAFRLHGNTPPEAALAITAWTHYANKLLKPGSDRKEILDRMNQIWKARKVVRSPQNKWLLKDLELTVKPTSATQGTPTWLIDQLTESSGQAGIMCDSSSDPNYIQLVELGFDAVPALIEHLDDSRLTRSYMSWFNNFPPYHRRVGELCTDILSGLVNEELGDGWLDRQRGITARKAVVTAWFDNAKRTGERQYLVSNVLTENGVRSQMLQVLAAKYPDTIPKLYRELLTSKSKGRSAELAAFVAKSELSNDQKLSLLTAGATHSSLSHRVSALWALKDVDDALFVQFLVATLEKLPRTPEGEYWTCAEARFAHLVMQTEASSAWAALRKAAQRSDVGLRMELMNPMNYAYIEDQNIEPRLRFLSSFLDDTSIRDQADSAKYQGPCAGMNFDRIAVRDFAALKIAAILGIGEDPNPEWTENQWQQFREKTQAALSQRESAQP